jgi:hypothetical protein
MAETPAPVTIELARFKSVDGSPPIDIAVHFNPASLQYTVQNTLKEEGQGAKKKQHVSQTTAKLTMDLVFDTTDTGADVRTVTDRMTKLLEPVGKSKAPRNVEFSWGAYKFTGLIEQYKETLDFFSPGGVPLRASVNLTLASQDVTFESAHNPSASVDSALVPDTVDVPARPGGGPPPSPAGIANELGAPRAARAIAAANGAPSLRFGVASGLTISAGIGLGAGIGVSAGLGALETGAGAAASIGGGVPLAPAAGFSAAAGLGVGADIGAVAGGAFGGLRAAGAAAVPIPDPRPLIEPASGVGIGAGVQFGPGGRALSAPSGASLSADVGANAEVSARLTFGS